MNIAVSVLRELFRNLEAFRAFYETEQQDTITSSDGQTYCLWDVEYLYSQIYRLSPRQREAIELCLLHNVKEKDAAIKMGVSPTNPVMMYATDGLVRICAMIESGEISRYREGVAA